MSILSQTVIVVFLVACALLPSIMNAYFSMPRHSESEQ